jgi:N-acetyl-anhydromuramyl-L-alanine amidase AmpD
MDFNFEEIERKISARYEMTPEQFMKQESERIKQEHLQRSNDLRELFKKYGINIENENTIETKSK